MVHDSSQVLRVPFALPQRFEPKASDPDPSKQVLFETSSGNDATRVAGRSRNLSLWW